MDPSHSIQRRLIYNKKRKKMGSQGQRGLKMTKNDQKRGFQKGGPKIILKK